MALTFLAKVDTVPSSATVPTNTANLKDCYYKTEDTAKNLYDSTGLFLNKTWSGLSFGGISSTFTAIVVRGVGTDYSNTYTVSGWDGTKPLPPDPTPPIDPTPTTDGTGLDPLAGTSYKLLPQAEKAKYIALTEGKVVQEATRIVTMYKGLLVYMDIAGTNNKPPGGAGGAGGFGDKLKKIPKWAYWAAGGVVALIIVVIVVVVKKPKTAIVPKTKQILK